ncbi:MAG: Na/Pi symporter [Bacteroidales bacterium]
MKYGITDILTLVGSLGLFLFGMKIMSEALQKVAGSKMRQVLSAMTSNRLKGVFTGFLITAVIQSSMATIVMIVSFVNAGSCCRLSSQSVSSWVPIFGTTVTAWIISILGFKVKMSAFSLPLIGLAFPLLFSKNNKEILGVNLCSGLPLYLWDLNF